MPEPAVTSSQAEPQHRRTRTVLYDGACALCTGSVAALRRADVLGRIEYRDVAQEWPSIAARYPMLDHDACLTDMHVVEASGRVLKGFEGYRSLAWVVPAGWPMIPLLYVPGVPALGKRIYRYVADHRSRTTCAVPPQPTGAALPTGRPPRD